MTHPCITEYDDYTQMLTLQRSNSFPFSFSQPPIWIPLLWNIHVCVTSPTISTLHKWMFAIHTYTHTIKLAPPLSSRWLDVSSPDGPVSNKIKIICASNSSLVLLENSTRFHLNPKSIRSKWSSVKIKILDVKILIQSIYQLNVTKHSAIVSD